MAEDRSLAEQLRGFFDELSTTQRVVIGAITITGILTLVGFGLWASQEPLDVLYSNLQAQDANNIVEQLKKMNVRYELSTDQKTILVPDKRVGDLRLKFAGEGLLKGDSVGFEKLEQPSLTATDFSQRLMFQKAQEKQLVRTIRSLAQVADATVHITPLKESVFLEEAQGAKASVVLTVKGNRILPEENVQAIVNLVAASVEGLKPDNVVVVDQHSRNLSKGQQDPLAGVTDSQRKIQRSEETYLVKQVVDLLEPVVGPNKVRAVARVELDFDKVKTSEEKFDPQGQVERSVKTDEEKHEKKEGQQGVPGTPSNVPPANASASSASPTELTEKKSTTTNYDISKKVSSTEKAPGSVKRLSVAVMLDHSTQWEKDPKGNYTEKLSPRTPEEIKKIKDQVAAAVGMNKERGDEITVENVAFASTSNPKEEADSRRREYIDLARQALPITLWTLGGLVLFYFIVMPVLRRISAALNKPVPLKIPSENELAKKNLVIKTMAEMEAEIEAEIDNSTAAGAPEAKRREIIKRRVQELTVEDPESAASLMRSWMLEDRS